MERLCGGCRRYEAVGEGHGECLRSQTSRLKVRADRPACTEFESVGGDDARKVWVVNVNNCEAYSDYYEGNQGVFDSREKAVAHMTERGFDPETRVRRIVHTVCNKEDPEWEPYEWVEQEAYRIEEWTVA